MRISDWSSDVALPISRTAQGDRSDASIWRARLRSRRAARSDGAPRSACGREDTRARTGGEPVDRLRTWLALSPEPAFGIPIGAAVPADQRSAHHRGDRGEDDGSDVSTGRRLYQMRRLAGGSDSGRGGAGGPLCDSRSQGRSEENRSEEHTSELQSLMRISYAVCCLTKKKVH